ncbi:MAG: hypothetical protein QXG00_03275, partial [Candidatus Woesearchaeota archaeon]
RGSFFLIDGLIGTAILIIAITTIYSYQTETPSNIQNYIISTDYLNIILSSQMRDLTNPYVLSKIKDGNITNLRNSLLIQNAEFYYRQKYKSCNFCLEIATNITKTLTEGILPAQYGISYSINGTNIYTRSPTLLSKAKLVINSKRITFFKINDTDVFGPVITEVKVWQ